MKRTRKEELELRLWMMVWFKNRRLLEIGWQEGELFVQSDLQEENEPGVIDVSES